MSRRDEYDPVAFSIPFDPDNSPECGLTKENVQEIIEELCLKTQTSASPGFSFGRSGNLASNTWLQNETVASNRSGRWVYINNAVITHIYVANEDIDTFDVSVYYHEGDEVNLTFVGSVTLTAARGGDFVTSFAVPTGKQLAVRITNGSAKNAVVGLELNGSV